MKEIGNYCKSISSNKLFSGLSPSDIGNICKYLEHESFKKGEYIIREDEFQNKVYVLVTGNAQVEIRGSKNEPIPISILTEGDFFGELSSFTADSRRTASVVAISDVEVLSLSSKTFDKLIVDYPDIMKNVLFNTARQLQESNRKIMYRAKMEREILEQRVKERTLKLQEKNAILQQQNAQIHKELLLAQNIQKKFLPKEFVKLKGLSIETYYLPCEELGGDICGIKKIDEDRTVIYGGDVSGHGVFASLITIYLKHLIENLAITNDNGNTSITDPGKVLTEVNKNFVHELNEGDPSLYFTVFYAIYDSSNYTLTYSSAGIHIPPIIFKKNRGQLLFKQSDFPIGHTTDNIYKTYTKRLERGDYLLFVSDGVTEAWNGKEIFGMERLINISIEVLKKEKVLKVKEIHKYVEKFIKGKKPEDDICYFSVHFE